MISVGIVIAFCCGGFVIARMSNRRAVLSALVPVLIFVCLVWAPVIIRGYTNHLTPWTYSLVCLFSAVAGSLIGLRTKSGKDIGVAIR